MVVIINDEAILSLWDIHYNQQTQAVQIFLFKKTYFIILPATDRELGHSLCQMNNKPLPETKLIIS